ncbi:hypothetical protein EVAR_17924_1 [Eumeta japonica]|uniref:FLYWCH-type domain-containing protein n=1 Tax=Eumeta variegata TaxID=151549 RepID=A0A4C1UY88_EUMVA|nr:hypothetical protein EVAR_17924_1 [Eumeta japonica]
MSSCPFSMGIDRWSILYVRLYVESIRVLSISFARFALINRPNVNFTITKSRYGKPVIVHQKYRYNRSTKSFGPKGIWLCSRKSLGCKAKMITVNDKIYEILDGHNH